MNRRISSAVTILILLVILADACGPDKNKTRNEAPGGTATDAGPKLPSTPFDYGNSGAIPAHIQNYINAHPEINNTPADNAITNDGATLGRVLFYDKSLSVNNTIACASCH